MQFDETRLITKKQLIAANKEAFKEEVRFLDTNFLESIPDHFICPVNQSLPFEEPRGFYRCWVAIGTDTAGSVDSYLMDVPTSVFESLAVYQAA